jgi:hypothetical protein
MHIKLSRNRLWSVFTWHALFLVTTIDVRFISRNTWSLGLKPVIHAPTEWKISDVPEGRVDIREYSSAHLLPPATKGVILREVPSGHGVNHAIEARVVLVEIAILVVIHAIELGKVLLHALEHISLNHHKPRGSVENLHESIFNGSRVSTKVNHETRCEHRRVAIVPGRKALTSLVPHHNLLGVTRNRNVVTRVYETHDRLWVKVDVGIHKHKEVRVRLLHKSTHGNVTRAVHQTLILGRVEQELNLFLHEQNLEPKYAREKRLKAQTTITRGAKE